VLETFRLLTSDTLTPRYQEVNFLVQPTAN